MGSRYSAEPTSPCLLPGLVLLAMLWGLGAANSSSNIITVCPAGPPACDYPTIVRLLAHQLDVAAEALNSYGQREQTRTDHLGQVMDYLGYRRASAEDLATLEDWLVDRALEHDRPTFLLHTAAERLRWDQILRPGLTVLERIVGTARERARTITFENLSHLFTRQGKRFLDQLLEMPEDDYRTPLTWLQRMPNAPTSTRIKTTLEKIRF